MFKNRRDYDILCPPPPPPQMPIFSTTFLYFSTLALLLPRVCREQVYLNGYPVYAFSSKQPPAENDDTGATLVSPRDAGSLVSSGYEPPSQNCAGAHLPPPLQQQQQQPPPPPPPFPQRSATVAVVGDNSNIEKTAGSINAYGEGVPGDAGVSPTGPTSAASTTTAKEEAGPRAAAGVTESAPRHNITTSPSEQNKSSPSTETPRKRYKHPAGEVLASSVREYLACPAGGEFSVEFRILADSSSSSRPAGRGAEEGEGRAALGAEAWDARVGEHLSRFGGAEGEEGGRNRAFPHSQGFLEIHKL